MTDREYWAAQAYRIAAPVLEPMSRGMLSTEMVAPKYQGKHLEYRLACYALAHYKKRHDFSYAWCTIHPHNPASIKSLANAGFRLYQANYVTPYGIRNIYIQKI